MSDIKVDATFESKVADVEVKSSLSLEGCSNDAGALFIHWLDVVLDRAEPDDVSAFAVRLTEDARKLNVAADALDELTQALNQE